MSAAAAARSILTRLHEVMASRTHAQGKLNQVVEIIGEALDSEVCSIYLLREAITSCSWVRIERAAAAADILTAYRICLALEMRLPRRVPAARPGTGPTSEMARLAPGPTRRSDRPAPQPKLSSSLILSFCFLSV